MFIETDTLFDPWIAQKCVVHFLSIWTFSGYIFVISFYFSFCYHQKTYLLGFQLFKVIKYYFIVKVCVILVIVPCILETSVYFTFVGQSGLNTNYKYQLVDSDVQIFYNSRIFCLAIINVAVSSYNYEFIYFSFLFCQFLLRVF